MKRILLAAAFLVGSIASAAAVCSPPAVMHDFPGTSFNMSLVTNPADGNCASVVATQLNAGTSTLTAWTSATTLNTTQIVMAAGQGNPAIQVVLDQTTTLTGGAVTFEGTFDGTFTDNTGGTAFPVPVAQVLNPNTFAPLTNPFTLVASTSSPFLILPNGYRAIRIKLSTVITGTATVTPFVTLLNYNPTVGAVLNPTPISQTTDGTSNGVRLTSQYPSGAVAVQGSATGTTAATATTLAATVSVTNFVCQISIRANATAAATGNATLSDGTKTFNFTQWTAPAASGVGVIEEIFNPCYPAAAVNTAWTLTSAAPGTGGVVSVAISGYQK